MNGTPITDPAEIEACRFLRGYYDKIGALAPAQFSVEEQHALTVLAAYVRARGEPIAWRWRYVYSSAKPGIWRVKQTKVVPQAGDSRLAGVEVQPLYGEVTK